MNKTKKSLLNAASIVTIVACAFAIIGSILMFIAAPFIDEPTILDLYKADPTSEVVEEADGGYKIYLKDDDGEIETIDDETLVIVVKVLKVACVALGLISFALAVAKLVLSIQILRGNSKDKYKKGCVIALLVLSILSSSMIETLLIIIAMCAKEKNIENNEINTANKKEDVVLKDISE